MTMDFFLGQLRLALVAALAYAGGRGWLTPTDSGFAVALITSLGPIVGPWLWSVYVNINGKIVPKDSVAIHLLDLPLDPGLQRLTQRDVGSVIKLPDAAKVVGAILIAFMLSAFAFPSDARAQGKLKLPIDPLHLNQQTAPGTIDAGLDPLTLIKKIMAAAAPDLAYANALATSAKTSTSGIRLQCIVAIQTLNAQATGANLMQADGKTPLVEPPEPHVFTDLEQIAEGIDSLSPTGPLFTSCAGAAALAGMNVMAFINALVTGTAAAALVVPK